MKGAVAVVLLTASVAAADGPAATARIESSGECALATVAMRSNELLGRTAITADARARITVTTAQDVDTYVATVTLIDESGTAQPARTMSASTCDELEESVAIVISLVLREAPASPPAPPPPTPPPPPLPAPALHDDTAYLPTPRVLRKALEFGATVGTTGEAAFVFGGRVDRARIAFGADLAVTLPDSVAIGTAAAHVMSARLDAAACARAGSLAGCALLVGGLIGARGDGLMDSRTAVRPMAAIAARVEWRQAMSARYGLRVFATVEQLLARPSFLVDSMPVWTAPSREAWLGIGGFLRLP